MKYILKNISHFDFFEGLEKYYTETTNLIERNDLNQLELEKKIDQLFSDVNQYLNNYCNSFYDEIKDILTHEYDFFISALDNMPELDDEIDRLNNFQNSLRLLIGYLSVIDALFDQEKEVTVETISDKKDFVLSKLNSVFGNEYYSIEKILKFNCIKYRDDESCELAEDLSRRGYTIRYDKYSNSDKVKISIKGASYIERKLSKNTTKNSELDRKIDIIIEQLTKLGLGQEIIFNEIEELRELQHKLSKKSWAQLLKGKLIDLALDKLISMETAKTVYEYLTSNNFKLLK